MAFCTNCGTELPDGGNVCPNCGYSFTGGVSYGAAPGPDAGNRQQYQQYQQYQQPDYEQQQYQYQQQYRQIPPGYDSEDIQKNRLLSVCSYISPLMILIPLIAQPDSKYCRFHANQALVLALFQLCCGIVCIIPILGWIAGGIGLVFALVCEIIGIVNSLSGKVNPLPLIGRIDVLH